MLLQSDHLQKDFEASTLCRPVNYKTSNSDLIKKKLCLTSSLLIGLTGINTERGVMGIFYFFLLRMLLLKRVLEFSFS